ISGFVSMAASVIAVMAGFVSGVLGFITNLVSSGVNAFQNMWTRTISAFSNGVSQAVSTVGRMPGAVLGVLGNVGSLLVSSGKALIQGFINGIKSMIGAVGDAARGVVQAARDFFPFSPARKGPFSGRGWVLYSGRSLGDAFATGIADTTPAAVGATSRLMSAASANLKGYKAAVGSAVG
ncbi:hypothetical protein GR239_36845, partial [Rhizobium leguminosarum]|uniref:hypothetical protein n=1 Tax=Rhizobium ruizarguesonis TaxID=2081791 RepID=UPI0013B8107A